MRRLVNLLASNNLLLRVVSYGRQHGRGGGSGEAKQEATRDRCFRPDGVIRLAKHLADAAEGVDGSGQNIFF